MPTVSVRDDIKSLIERKAGIRVVGEAYVHGVKEYHSNCPFPGCEGSTDGFITCPDTGRYSHAIRSKGCGRTGDGVDFLVDYCGMSKAEAIRELGLEGVLFAPSQPESKRTRNDPSPQKWQDTGWNFVERAARYLGSSAPKAQEALAYLRSRGLDDETIRRKKYGYCPLAKNGRWFGEDPKEGGLEHWGLKPEDVSQRIRERGTVLIPPGIVIPWWEGDTLWKIAVKRPSVPKPDDYRQIAGSVDALYNVDSIRPGQPCMIVEAEFCAAAIEQCAGDLVAVVATGSADKGRNPRFISTLSLPSCLVQAFDNDEAGEAGAIYWLSMYSHCFRYGPVEAKDPNDMLKAHGTQFVRDWVQGALDTWENLRPALLANKKEPFVLLQADGSTLELPPTFFEDIVRVVLEVNYSD